MNIDCQRYAEDPEANASHLSACESCRAAYGAVATRPVEIDSLPLAPWEGANYRAWPLVVGGALVVLALALALCSIAGISPVEAITAGVRAQNARAAIALVEEKLHPLGPFVFAALFVIVNSILVLLLRRAPRGIDA